MEENYVFLNDIEFTKEQVVRFVSSKTVIYSMNFKVHKYLETLSIEHSIAEDILDEDDLSSNSATKVASQQSIKAYVDAQLTAQDLDVTSDSGTIDIDLNSETLTIAGGTGLASSASSTTVTLAIDSTVATLTGSQTLTNKTFTSPTINEWTFVSGNTMSGLTTDSTIIFEGATADDYETSLNVTDPTADRVITIPDATMTCVTTATHSNKATVISKIMAMG